MDNLFLSNYSEIKFLDKLKENLKKCKSFYFSVSFIKNAGLVLLEKDILDALNRGASGKIITSTYQNFTDIHSLRKFLKWQNQYPNFECHLDLQCFGDNGFHTKGYLFEYDKEEEFLVGSTNITRFALLKNMEWNISLKSDSKLDSIISAKIEFDDLWNKTCLLNEDLISRYALIINYSIEKWDMDYFDPETIKLKPNFMQRKALKELRRYRDYGTKRALIIAATGSGKTFLAAFDAKNFGAQRVLFIVHRETILHDAMQTFENVFGSEKTYGLFTGSKNEIDADYIFASNIMMSTHLDCFKKDEFDYIVIDECHHASAGTYKKIMDYFEPEFILGLTATPERMDNQDIYDLFDENVPFELRLNDAINNDLIVPFHYYGIRDKFADYKSSDKSALSREICNSDNINFVCSEIEKHRPVGKLKCIAFCVSISHCHRMAEELEEKGYNTISLTGSDDVGRRIISFKNLQDDNHPLEIICTVDILNEGVDIPQVNTILFLRPTESSTIFIQQLGRGLRKYENKEYCSVLDFIGNNYDRSVQIAMALGSLGKNTGIEKAYLRDLVATNFASLNVKGVKILIDELAKEEIIDYISKTNFNTRKFLEKDFENFWKYLKQSEYPYHMDFFNSDVSPDLMRLMKSKINGKKNRSYYQFLKNIEKCEIPEFEEDQIEFINNLSDLLPLTRPDEYLIVKQLLNDEIINLDILTEYNKKVNIKTLTNALHYLKKDLIIRENNTLNFNKLSKEFKDYLEDLLEYGLTRCLVEFGEFEEKFKLYGNYYKEQIMKELLETSSMYMKGTKFSDDRTTYCFVGLKKDKQKQERTNYKDKFISKDIFQWESENNTTKTNSTGLKILNTKIVHLFIRKMDEEDGITLPFTYVGSGKFENIRESYVESKEIDGSIKQNKTLLCDIRLDKSIIEDYFFDFEVPNDSI